MAVRKVGTCRIVGELGRGGMGVVYEAFQEGLERRVAVKALDGRSARSRELSERFRREGRAYAQLRHQAIVAVHDLVEKDEGLYLVTDFVDGADLSKLLQAGGPLPAACVAIVGARLAEALDYVHFHKLLHRDVKPANAMISRDGEVKLMDFGIAKAEDAPDLTRAGMLVGSPSYIAPEVLDGEDEAPASDLYALGVTLYELSTGEKPYTGRNPEELFRAVRRGGFRKVRALAPDVPRRLARAIEKCLARRPAARWRTAGHLGRELDRLGAKLARGMHPQARLVALMANRGFVEDEEALSVVGTRELAGTRAVDASTEVARPPRSGALRLAVAIGIGVAAGAAAWFVRF